MKHSVSVFDLLPTLGASPVISPDMGEEPNQPSRDDSLDAETIIELWEERSAIQETDNWELVERLYSENAPAWEVRRVCELFAAADLALLYGELVCEILRPRITKEPTDV